jgi:hypothetical protein
VFSNVFFNLLHKGLLQLFTLPVLSPAAGQPLNPELAAMLAAAGRDASSFPADFAGRCMNPNSQRPTGALAHKQLAIAMPL